MSTSIWAARLDNAYNREVIYDEPTVMVFEPRFVPDVADVACWENQIIEFIDGRGAQE